MAPLPRTAHPRVEQSFGFLKDANGVIRAGWTLQVGHVKTSLLLGIVLAARRRPGPPGAALDVAASCQAGLTGRLQLALRACHQLGETEDFLAGGLAAEFWPGGQTDLCLDHPELGRHVLKKELKPDGGSVIFEAQQEVQVVLSLRDPHWQKLRWVFR